MLAGAALVAGLSLPFAVGAQTPLPQPDPLSARDARRLDRMEQVMRELRSIVFQGRETGRPVVVQPAETADVVSGMTERVGSLEQTLTRLNGTLETLQHDLSTTRQELQQSRAANEALAARVTALEGQLAPGAQTPQVSAPQQDGPSSQAAGDPEAEFVAARRLLWDGNYASAESAFGAYLERNADGPRRPEAQYYFGKTLLARRAYPEAAQALIAAIRGWPQTEWAPDGVLSLARALHGMSRNPDACQALGELRRRYPRASADVANRATALRTQAQCAA